MLSNPPNSLERSVSPRTAGSRPSPHIGYDDGDDGGDDSGGETASTRRRIRQSPKLPSPATRSTRRTILEGTRNVLSSPDKTNTGEPFPPSSAAASHASGSTNSSFSRIGNFMSGRSSDRPESRGAEGTKAGYADDTAGGGPAPKSISAAQGATQGQPSNEPPIRQSLASRFLRPKSSRQKLDEFGDTTTDRREGHGLGSAFGFRSENRRTVEPAEPPSGANHGVHPEGSEESPTIPEHDSGHGNTSQSGTSSRPSSLANALDMAPSASRAANGAPVSRGGRLGRLQYKKSEGLSISSVGRDSLGSAREGVGAPLQDFAASNQGLTSHADRQEAWASRAEPDNNGSGRPRLPSSSYREMAQNRAGASSLAGLGIESGFADDAGMPPASNAATAADQGSATQSEPFRYDMAPTNGDAGPGRSGHSSQHSSSGYQGIGTYAGGGEHEAGHARSSSNAQAVDSGRAVSRTSGQDKFHNRFSKQTASDGSRYSTRSSAPGRDAGDMSPPSEAYTSPTLSQQATQAKPSASLYQRHRHQQTSSSSGSEALWTASQRTGISNGIHSDTGSAAATSKPRPASPPVGSLSDAAIVAMGAVPGSSPEALYNANGAPLSSKNVLTIALQKAQSAVQLDSANQVAEAIAAYRQAVRLLDEVMARIAPKHGRKSRPSREEERRRLRVIHDTYADRIRLLSLICAPEEAGEFTEEDNSYDQSRDEAIPVRDETEWDEGRLRPGQRSDLERDGDQSFLSMTPIAERHDTSTMDRFLSGPSGEISATGADGTSRSGQSSRGAISVADEQGEFDAAQAPSGSTPQISIQTTVRQEPGSDTQDSQEILLDPYTTAPATSRDVDQMTGHARSDSDSSYHSTRTKGNVGSSFRSRPKDSPRSLGLDEESRRPPTPATPFFDAADARTSIDESEDAASGGRDTKPPSLSGIGSSGTEERLRTFQTHLGDRTTSLNPSRSQPALRAKGSMPSLRAIRDTASRADTTRPALQGRPSSADSPPNATIPTLGDASTSTPHPKLINRPRATTLVSKRLPPTAADTEALVSSTTSTGTISQRRKQAVPQVPALPVPLRSDAMARTYSAERADAIPSGVASGLDGPVASSQLPYSRQRAISQPGSRRPSIPAAFLAANASADLAPPVPKLTRNLSAGLVEGVSNGQENELVGPASAPSTTAAAPPPTLRKASDTAAALQQAAVIAPTNQVQGSDGHGQACAALRDVFPSGLPSLASGTPSYATGSSGVSLFPWLGLASKLPDPSSTPSVPLQPVLRPFHVMRMLLRSIGEGGYVTQRLYVPKGLWLQQGARLVSIESKVRAMELVSTGLEAVAKGGEQLLRPPGSGLGLETSNGSKFAKHLDELDALMIEAQNSLAKKLGFLETVTGKKASTFSGVFGSKLTRSLDRMTNGKSLDSPVIYVEGLARLFARAQVLDTHLICLLRAQGTVSAAEMADALPTPSHNSNVYSALPTELRAGIEARLRRSSDFFAKVILAFVLRDVGVLLDKFAKRGSLVFTE
ncbi:uncharacterized protein PSFLO_04867 [Pseudozyma flocculosa]|nr:uncharacterized protein PSFLO_04867 [Pseudozyma flocculosa]